MQISKLIEELDKLNLPKDQYAIVGSGPLAIRDLREAQDLDIVVTDSLWGKIAQQYPVEHTPDLPLDKIDISNISILGRGSSYCDDSIATVSEMIATADLIGGHRFLNLVILKKIKQKMGREKDLKDIELINNYLALQNR